MREKPAICPIHGEVKALDTDPYKVAGDILWETIGNFPLTDEERKSISEPMQVMDLAWAEIEKDDFDNPLTRRRQLMSLIACGSMNAMCDASDGKTDVAWGHLFSVGMCIGRLAEIANGEDDKLVRRVRSEIAKMAAQAKLANDKRQVDRNFVYECWQDWRAGKTQYKSKAQFARDMLEKCDELVSAPVIEGWCREWEKKHTAS